MWKNDKEGNNNTQPSELSVKITKKKFHVMLKIQMLEQIMNNDNSDDEECEKSQVDSDYLASSTTTTATKTSTRR